MKRGVRYNIYGAFKSKDAAKRSERKHGAFIVTRTIKGHKRYVVIKERGR